MSNIDQDGFASASFHSFADTLKWDGYSGDYGPNFVGHALGFGTFLVHHEVFGWQAFGGIVTTPRESNRISVQVHDTVRRRVFIAPLGTLFTLDAGSFDSFTFDPSKQSVDLVVTSAPRGATRAAAAPRGRIIMTRTANIANVSAVVPSKPLETDAGAFVIPFRDGSATITFNAL